MEIYEKTQKLTDIITNDYYLINRHLTYMLAIKSKDFLSNILPIQKTTISLRLLNERLINTSQASLPLFFNISKVESKKPEMKLTSLTIIS